jgi:gliding motility-associated lipoprotein GldH
MKHFLIFLIVPLALLSLTSCDENRVFEKNLALEDANWDRTQVARFEVEITDTVSYYNLYVNVRNSGQYPYRNLYLFTQIRNPFGQFARDTAEFILADPKGNWFGKGIGDLWEHQFPYKQSVMFPRKGTYILELEQAMRDKELKYITDIGIRVEKVAQ